MAIYKLIQQLDRLKKTEKPSSSSIGKSRPPLFALCLPCIPSKCQWPKIQTQTNNKILKKNSMAPGRGNVGTDFYCIRVIFREVKDCLMFEKFSCRLVANFFFFEIVKIGNLSVNSILFSLDPAYIYSIPTWWLN